MMLAGEQSVGEVAAEWMQQIAEPGLSCWGTGSVPHISPMVTAHLFAI